MERMEKDPSYIHTLHTLRTNEQLSCQISPTILYCEMVKVDRPSQKSSFIPKDVHK